MPETPTREVTREALHLAFDSYILKGDIDDCDSVRALIDATFDRLEAAERENVELRKERK